MRVLLDTNLLIGREDPHVLSPPLAALLRILSTNSVPLVIHPASVAEISGDRDAGRRDMVLSKVSAYPLLDNPPEVDDNFVGLAGGRHSSHDGVDLALLKAVEANAVSFLVSEDQDLVARAPSLGLVDRVLDAASALEYFSEYFGRVYPIGAPYLLRTHLYNIDRNDAFFNSFREDYSDFDAWLAKASSNDRLCYCSRVSDGRLGSILILKEGDTDSICGLKSTSRLKICSLKVSQEQAGFRLGETLIALALDYAGRNRVGECYVTVFPKYGELVALLTTFGFRDACNQANGEKVLIKSILPPPGQENLSPLDFLRSYFPSIRDDREVRKFLVPIQPDYHRRLFPDYGVGSVQRTLDGSIAMPPPAGNAIRKAYLCRAKTKRIRPGDLLMFYRSADLQALTHIGIVERIATSRSPEEVIAQVGNRTILPFRTLEEMCKSPVLTLLFWNAGAFAHKISLSELQREGLSWPQSVVEVDHPTYQRLIGEAGLIRSYFQ